ncbi:hypothetical protein [Streptomyces sp. NPDC021562]|uniref:hypothetical protein n=1 Tax=Streptomyces sp. NPDC021562 TaxID=3155121 RepID=UPI0033CF1848
MLVAPVARAWVPDLAEDGRLGLCTGALSSVSGLIVLLGSAGTGTLLDAAWLPPAVPWVVLAGVTAVAVVLLPRAGGVATARSRVRVRGGWSRSSPRP